MGTFGNEFQNALDNSAIGSTAEDVSVARQLETWLAGLHTSHPNGVIAYLPPRTYRIEPRMIPGVAPRRRFADAFNTPDLWIRNKTMLWFAPGAKLEITENAVVRIDGPLRAETTQIFKCVGTDSPTVRRGRVLLYSTKIGEVYPEWWGAMSSPDDMIFANPSGTDDTDALVDCIRAAHTDRAFPTGQLPPLPIVLRGTYTIRREIEVSAKGTQLPRDLPAGARNTLVLPDGDGIVNAAGLVLLGRRGVGSANAGSASLAAGADFQPPFDESGTMEPPVERRPKGRALLRIDGLHGSVIDGVGFNGTRRASVCMQITGQNARSTTFRGCSFAKARHVLAQVGDYVITDGTVNTQNGVFSRILTGLNPGLDLSGLLFEQCTFDSDVLIRDFFQVGDEIPHEMPTIAMPTRRATQADVDARNAAVADALRVAGIVFQANNTLPMTLDNCLFHGGMRACVEAFGGTLVVRGGNAQNKGNAIPYQPNVPASGMPYRFERGRGGVDFFLGDPLLQNDTQSASPTGLTIVQFESQSDQLLDTFRHLSASAGRVAFFPSVLQGASHRITQARLRAPPSIVWAGPGIRHGVANTAALSLVGCLVGGPRLGVDSAPPSGTAEPSGVVVVDPRVFLVGDVGTRTTSPSTAGVFFSRDFSVGCTFNAVPVGTGATRWFRSL